MGLTLTDGFIYVCIYSSLMMTTIQTSSFFGVSLWQDSESRKLLENLLKRNSDQVYILLLYFLSNSTIRIPQHHE